MGYRKSTIRKKTNLPLTRNFMKRINAIDSEMRKLRKLVEVVEAAERTQIAFLRASEIKEGKKVTVGFIESNGNQLGKEGMVNVQLPEAKDIHEFEQFLDSED